MSRLLGGMMGGMMDGLKGLFGGAGEPGLDQGLEQGLDQEQEVTPPAMIVGEVEKLTASQRKVWKERMERSKDMIRPYVEAADELKSEYLTRKDPRYSALQQGQKKRPINYIASFINTTMPMIMPANAWPLITPRESGEEWKTGAELTQARMRQIWERPNSYSQIRRAAFDAYFMAGFVMTGWNPALSQFVDTETKETNKTEDNVPDLDVPRSMTDASYATRYDEAFYRHIAYKDMLLDWDVSCWDDQKFTGYIVRKPLREIKSGSIDNGGRYYNLDDLDSTLPTDEDPESDRYTKPKADATVKLHVIFHRGRNDREIGVLILASDKYIEIRHDMVEFGSEGIPIRCLGYIDVGELLPANPINSWVDLNDAANEFAKEATQRASEQKKLILTPNQETSDAITEARGGGVLTVPDPNIVKEIQIGGTSPDTWNALSFYEQSVDRISGIADFQRGLGTQGGKKTAREINVMTAFTQTRIGDYQASLNRFMQDLAEDMGGMFLKHQWQDVPVTVPRVGGQTEPGSFSANSVPGGVTSYNFRFDVAEQERNSPVVQQKRFQELLALMGDPNMQQAAQQAGFALNPTAALEDYLKSLGVQDIERYIKPVPTPEEQAEAERQKQAERAAWENQQMTETGSLMPVDAERDDHTVHGQIHMQESQDETILEHLSEHLGMMELAESMGGDPSAGGPDMRGRLHEGQGGPALASPRGIGTQGTEQLQAQSEQVA